MPETYAATPGSQCHQCQGTGPLVHKCKDFDKLECMTCHDTRKIQEITRTLLEGAARKSGFTLPDL